MTALKTITRRVAMIGAAGALAIPGVAIHALAADPVVELVRAWEAAAFGTNNYATEEEFEAFMDHVLHPLEERLMKTAPGSPSGAVALLRAAEKNLLIEGVDAMCWEDKFNIALVGNVRRALTEGRIRA